MKCPQCGREMVKTPEGWSCASDGLTFDESVIKPDSKSTKGPAPLIGKAKVKPLMDKPSSTPTEIPLLAIGLVALMIVAGAVLAYMVLSHPDAIKAWSGSIL
jgi:hypothetical protein